MRHRSLFLAIEVNLILWIVVGFRTDWDGWVVFGLILSAVVQHWAYYSLVRGGGRQGHIKEKMVDNG